MKPVQAIFFDLDETLMDDEQGYRQSLALTCDELAATCADLDAVELAHRYDELSTGNWTRPISQIVGEDLVVARLRLWRGALESCGRADDALAVLARDTYALHRLATAAPFPDVVAMLDQLRGCLKLGVITNGWLDQQREKLEVTGLLPYFDVVVAASELGTGKPDPQIFCEALGRLDLRPEAVWHVGDNLETDVAGAKAAGLTAVWLNRDGRERQETAVAPDYEIASLAELTGLLGLG